MISEVTLKNSMKKIEKKNVEDIFALSPVQEGILFHYIKDPDTESYVEQLSLNVSGRIDNKLFEMAWNFVIETNEMLRTVFRWENVKNPIQIVLKQHNLNFKYHDISNKLKTEKEKLLEEIKSNDRKKKFDLHQVPFRITLCKIEIDRYEIIICNHHILFDGWSYGIILNEFFNNYINQLNKRVPEIPIKNRYREYVKWIKKQDKFRQKKFWRQYLGDFPSKTELSIKKGQGREIRKVEKFHFKFKNEIKCKLESFVKKYKITLSTLIYSAWGILLLKYNNSNDIIFGTTVSGRSAKLSGIQDMVGLFINTLPLRIQCALDEKIISFLCRINQSLQVREEFEASSIINIVEWTKVVNKEELFNTIVVIENYPLDRKLMVEKGHLPLSVNSYSIVEMTHYDLALGIKVYNDIEIDFHYNKNCFDKEVIENMADHFTNIVGEFLNDHEKEINKIEILSEEKRKELYEFNKTSTNYPSDKTIQELFEEQSQKNQDRIAVIFEYEQITYGELNKRANRLARVLQSKGIKNNNIVGLMLDRSINMMIGILGILKAGGAYLPIDEDYPKNRIISMLEDSRASLLLTSTANVEKYSFAALRNLSTICVAPQLTGLRSQIKDFNNLPIPDRSLVDYEKYSKSIGMAMAKTTIAIQATRGCPFECLYCHKIWPKSHVIRSAENIFQEVQLYYKMGVRRFLFIDDIFNLNKANSIRFFRLVIKNGLDIQIFFPNGIRGDILTHEYIDLMVEAGTVNIALALETASSRLQKLIGKNINLEKLYKNMDYICKKYPHIISELFTMHGFPTETEEEALMTLDFIKSLKWLHLPHINILKIYPNTDMAKFALENGISMEKIISSENLAYHELPDTLPFDKSFTLKYQTNYLNEYFLLKERLLHVLPHQMKLLTESEIVEKYNSFLPMVINSFTDLLQLVGIGREELGVKGCLDEECMKVPCLNKKLKNSFPQKKPFVNALRVMLLDLSQFFSDEADILYDVVEAPLGLMYLMTYLNKQFGRKINGKIVKSRIDFDNYEELKLLLDEFNPDIIGIRTLTYYKEFFHETVAMIRNWGFDIPIIVGGPYATSDYIRILQDKNVNLVVLGEGEVTFSEVVNKIILNNKKLPGEKILKEIPGIAFVSREKSPDIEFAREILILDRLTDILSKGPCDNHKKVNKSLDLAYVMYTSGSTGKSKGVMVTHKNVIRLVKNTNYVEFTPDTRVLQTGALVFDATTFEIWGSLLNGGHLCLVDWEVILDSNKLGKALINKEINTLWLSSSLFNQLMQQNSDIFSSLKYLVVGGDILSPLYINMVRNKNKALKVVNGYGPTENTTFSTCCLIDKNFKEDIPIGKPICNSRAYILDNHGCLQPTRVVGELYVGGEGVSRGYLNSPELTSEKFVVDPFIDTGGKRLYRTGDLTRWRPEGNIEFIGRKDHQVKIRGFRVELGEIETLLLKYDKIKDAVVLVRETKGENDRYTDSRNKFLCAYFVSDIKLSKSVLREYLAGELPGYMIPSYFIQIEKFPLNVNGKIDRKVLPDPEAKGDKEKYSSPRSDIEKRLVEIWSKVLGIEKECIGIDDNFFELGGHSLKATTMLIQIHKEFGTKLPIQMIYETPVISKISEYIKKVSKSKYEPIKVLEKKAYYELSYSQRRFWVLSQFEDASLAFNIPIALVIEEELNVEALSKAFITLVKRHESLRTIIKIIDCEPTQKIRFTDEVDFGLEYIELMGIEDRELKARELIDSEMEKPFDLEKGPLLRVNLIHLEERKYILLLMMHHIISDMVSMNILLEEFQTLYSCSRDGGKENPLKPLRIQYKDYVAWQNRQISEKKEEHKQYFLNQLGKDLSLLKLPTDKKRPRIMSYNGDVVSCHINKNLTEGLKNLGNQNDATLFMILLTAFNILLFRYSNQTDIVIGIPTAGREHCDLEGQIGLYINTLALRTRFSREDTVLSLLNIVKNVVIGVYEHQVYPFDMIMDELGIKRDISRHPIFDVALNMLNYNDNENRMIEKKLKMTLFGYESNKSKFDLTVNIFERRDTMKIDFEYKTDLFETETIAHMAECFVVLMNSIIKNPSSKISNLPIDKKIKPIPIKPITRSRV